MRGFKAPSHDCSNCVAERPRGQVPSSPKVRRPRAKSCSSAAGATCARAAAPPAARRVAASLPPSAESLGGRRPAAAAPQSSANAAKNVSPLAGLGGPPVARSSLLLAAPAPGCCASLRCRPPPLRLRLLLPPAALRARGSPACGASSAGLALGGAPSACARPAGSPPPRFVPRSLRARLACAARRVARRHASRPLRRARADACRRGARRPGRAAFRRSAPPGAGVGVAPLRRRLGVARLRARCGAIRASAARLGRQGEGSWARVVDGCANGAALRKSPFQDISAALRYRQNPFYFAELLLSRKNGISTRHLFFSQIAKIPVLPIPLGTASLPLVCP